MACASDPGACRPSGSARLRCSEGRERSACHVRRPARIRALSPRRRIAPLFSALRRSRNASQPSRRRRSGRPTRTVALCSRAGCAGVRRTLSRCCGMRRAERNGASSTARSPTGSTAPAAGAPLTAIRGRSVRGRRGSRPRRQRRRRAPRRRAPRRWGAAGSDHRSGGSVLRLDGARCAAAPVALRRGVSRPPGRRAVRSGRTR